MDVATQTEKSYLRDSHKKKKQAKQIDNTGLTTVQQENLPKPLEVIEKKRILCCEFEVFGIVQDVSFRHYTLRRAQKLSIRGWCMNSDNNTVLGVIQGYQQNFEAMRLWLAYTGSPTSRIDKCVFGGTLELENFTFEEFGIRYE